MELFKSMTHTDMFASSCTPAAPAAAFAQAWVEWGRKRQPAANL
jgi:hypothetical protein